MRTKILSMMIMTAMIAVLFAGMAHADTTTAEAPQWTVGDKWAFGGDGDLKEYAKPYVDMVKAEAASSPEITNADASVTGTAGVWVTAEVTAATDTEYTLHYRMSESVDNLKAHASATGMMPKAGTYSSSDTPLTTQMTMSADVSLDHATVISGDVKFVKDTMAVKSITMDVEQKTAFNLKGKNLPGEDTLMGDMMGGTYDGGTYDGGYDSGGDYTYPELSTVIVDNNITVRVASNLTWGDMKIEAYDSNYNVVDTMYGSSPSVYMYACHSDGATVSYDDPVEVGDRIIITGGGIVEVDFYSYNAEYDYYSYLDNIYFSSTRDISGFDGNYTISYQDYDISFTEEFHANITVNFNPPLNLLDFPINVGEQWDVYSNVSVSGTYGGTIDASGLPDKAVQQIKNETGQDFPIDIAKLDTDTDGISNGQIAESDSIDFTLQCTGTMQITDENGNSLTVFKLSQYYDSYSYWKGDTEPSVLYSPDKKFIAGMYTPAGASPIIPGISGSMSSELSLLSGASTTDTKFTYADYNTASSNIDKTDTSMSSIGEPDSLLSLGSPLFLAVILGVIILIVVLALVMRKKKPQQPGPQMAPYPDPYAPQQPPAYYPPPQPQEPQGPPQNQTPPPPTY